MTSTFFGHPRGLATLFLTEMWERFTFYGMRALLVLFLVADVGSGGLGLDDKTAVAIYGLYTASTYLAGLPGGWIGDRLIGAQRAVLVGGLFITLGNILLTVSISPRSFYLGLAVIVIGVGLLKPNVSAIVAGLYPEGGARLDAAFTIFYLGINLGAVLGPLVTAEAWILWGPRAAFAAGALGMTFGLAQYLATRRYLGAVGKNTISGGNLSDQPAAARRGWLWLGVGVMALSLLASSLFMGWLPLEPAFIAAGMTGVIVAVAVLFFIYYLAIAELSPDERRRGAVLLVLFIGSALFWSGFEQAGSSLNLFAERYTIRTIAGTGLVVPAAWFQSLNSVFIFLCAPFFAWGWIALARRNLNPSAPAKFALGLIFMGAGFLVMAAAATVVASGSKVLPTWLIFTYLLHTFGELCLSPVGLSYYTKLAPQRFVGQIMGLWFLSLSLGNLAASLIAAEFDAANLAAMPEQYRHIVYFAVGVGAILMLVSNPIKKLMGDVV